MGFNAFSTLYLSEYESLAFEESGANLLFDERLGIIIGSLASGILGYLILRASLRSNKSLQPTGSADD